MEPSLFTVAQVAAQLNLGRTLLYREMNAGRLAFVKVGKSRRITPDAIRNYVYLLQHEAEK